MRSSGSIKSKIEKNKLILSCYKCEHKSSTARLHKIWLEDKSLLFSLAIQLTNLADALWSCLIDLVKRQRPLCKEERVSTRPYPSNCKMKKKLHVPKTLLCKIICKTALRCYWENKHGSAIVYRIWEVELIKFSSNNCFGKIDMRDMDMWRWWSRKIDQWWTNTATSNQFFDFIRH